MSERLSNRRIRLLLGVFVLVFAATLARAVWLQGVQASTLERMAVRQQRGHHRAPAARGTIYDRTGEPLAIGEQATTVYADPRRVKNPRAGRARRGRGARPRRGEALSAPRRPLPALRLREAESRSRQGGRARAAAAGGARLLRGGAALLSAAGGRVPRARLRGRRQRGARGPRALARPLAARHARQPDHGHGSRRPRHRRCRDAARAARRRRLSDARPAHPGERRVGPARDGEALGREGGQRDRARPAHAVPCSRWRSAPSFDANAFGSASAERRRNRAVTDVYEPGSTFKVVTVAAALSEKIVTPTTPFTLQSSIRVADRIIHEHEPRPTRRMTVAQILSQSSNVGTITLAQMLGRTRVEQWIERFGFGKQTGIDAPGESAGLLPSLLVGLDDRQRADRPGDRRDADPDGGRLRCDRERRRPAQAAPRRPRRHEMGAARQGPARDLEDRVGADDGDAPRRRLGGGRDGRGGGRAGIHRGGEDRDRREAGPGGYSTSKYVASFVGVVPAKNPRLVVLVSIDEPRGAIWGGVVAAPAFAEIARSSLVELEVAPDAAPTP